MDKSLGHGWKRGWAAVGVALGLLFPATGRTQAPEPGLLKGDPPLMEDFKLAGKGVDTWVLDKVFVMGDAEMLSAPDPRIQLMGRFRQQLKSYSTPESLQRFMELASQYMNWTAGAESSVDDLSQMPGGSIVITNRGNETYTQLIQRESQRRMEQIDSYTLVKNFQYDRAADALQPEDFAEPAVIGPMDERESIRRLLRGWELNGIRFLMTHAGSPVVSRHVWGYYGGQFSPTYRNSLNAVLDPVRRRFRTVQVYDPRSDGVGMQPRVSEYPDSETNSAIALVEFTGALPEAKLFSDWKSGLAEKALNDKLYQPGFNPHAAVLFSEPGLPTPDQPAKTLTLPAVTVEAPDELTRQVVLPPLTHNVVLLINSLRDFDWVTTLDNQPATLLKANGRAPALLLAASDAERIVVLKREAPKGSAFAGIAIAVGALCLAAVLIIRRRNDAVIQADLDGKP